MDNVLRERRVLRRRPALRPDLQGTPRPAGLPRPDVRVFEVFDNDGKPLGLFIADYYAREQQARRRLDERVRRRQTGLFGTKPVVANHLNMPKPPDGPADAADLRRSHHHVPRVRPRPARHVLEREVSALRRHQRAARLRRVPVAGATRCGPTGPQVLANYAKHYQTGAPMPAGTARQGRWPRRSSTRASPPPSTWPRPCSTSRWHQLTAERGAGGRRAGLRGQRADQGGRRGLRAGAAALSQHLLLATSVRRLLRGLLRLPVERSARCRQRANGSRRTAA